MAAVMVLTGVLYQPKMIRYWLSQLFIRDENKQFRVLLFVEPFHFLFLCVGVGVDGKVIHLVKRPPPSVRGQGEGAAEGQSSGAGSEGAGPVPGGVTVQATQDVVIMGNIPVSSHSDITQVTQVSVTAFLDMWGGGGGGLEELLGAPMGLSSKTWVEWQQNIICWLHSGVAHFLVFSLPQSIVDQIVNSLSSQGAQAQVSAETITTVSEIVCGDGCGSVSVELFFCISVCVCVRSCCLWFLMYCSGSYPVVFNMLFVCQVFVVYGFFWFV